MKSTVYFRVSESRFRVGAAHPVDKSLIKRKKVHQSNKIGNEKNGEQKIHQPI